MAAKKKEGVGALKEISGGKRRDDRNVSGKTYFDPLTVDARNALTVIHMLKSPEDDIMLRAVASLEGFGKKDPENLKCLCSLGISEYLLPLIDNSDFIVKRFTLKLIGMLSKLEEFRAQLLQMDNVLKTFSWILRTDPDVLLQEFSSLTLANLSSDYAVASDLLKVENIIDTLFNRIRSLDPDVEKNCLDIMIHLLNDVNGIDVFVESPGFELQPILNLIFSSYPVIQALALEVLTQLTSWCRDIRILIAFRDTLGLEQILSVLEKEEWSDLHLAALDLLLNVTDSPEICDYLYRSGCLQRFVSLLDNISKKTLLERIIGILARMSQSSKARPALHSVEAEKKFINYLEESSDSIQEASCLGIANQCQYFPSLDIILAENPIKGLMGIITSRDKSPNLLNMAAYTLNVLSNIDERVPELLLNTDDFDKLLSLLIDSARMSTEMCQNLVQVLIGISSSERLRPMAVRDKLFKALISCLPTSSKDIKKDVSLQVDALECLSEFLTESDARDIFERLNGVCLTLNCLFSRFASVREWAGHLVVIASQSETFIKSFIRMNGLQWMLKEKNTMYSMPSWQSAIESIFNNFLPAKFAYTGRLDFQDITKDGFYILTQPNASFVELEYFFEEKISPIVPIYVASFHTPLYFHEGTKTKSTTDSLVSTSQMTDTQNMNKYMKAAGRNSQEEYVWHGSINTYSSVDYESPKIEHEYTDILEQYFPDNFLNEHLENLKKKIAKEETCIDDSSWLSLYRKLICERAKIIAEFVADEMSGPEPDPACSAHYKITQIDELKRFLGSNIIPLGLIRMGDYLERAMLFKVLADRIGFSCALVRGSYGRAWIEIALPVINADDLEEEIERDKCDSVTVPSETSCHATESTNNSNQSTSQNSSENRSSKSASECDYWFPNLKIINFKGFPKYFLRPNAIVDLVNEPGRVLNINSCEAKEYCGGFLFAKNEVEVVNSSSV